MQLKKLTLHKYSAQGCSLLEPYMQKFWVWLVQQVPLWWAPNAITLAGLIMNVVTTAALIYYCPDATQQAPSWALYLCAMGLFVYQALDAIDGKQARRTNSSTPLGELFDHGCDCVSIVFVVIGWCIALQLGRTPQLMMVECFATVFLFYSAHWRTYCTGALKFGWIDVTEAQFFVMLIYVLTGLFGNDLWSYILPVVGVEVRVLPVAVSVATAVYCGRSYFSVILLQGGVGKNGSTVAGTSVLSPGIPIGLLILLGVVTARNSPSHIYEHHAVLFVLSYGLACSKVTCRLVIAHMATSPMELFDVTMVGPLLLYINQYLNCVVSEYFVLWTFFLYCLVDLLRYAYQACRQICAHMNIHCFSITPPPARPTATTPTAASLLSSAIHRPIRLAMNCSSYTKSPYTTDGQPQHVFTSSYTGGVRS